MARDERVRPLLAQIPAPDLSPDGLAPSTARREAGRGRTSVRVKMVVAGLFLALSVVSVLALARAAERAVADRIDSSDVALLALLVLMASAVAAQALAMMAGLPPLRSIRQRRAARQGRRLAQRSGPRPLLERVPTSTLLQQMSPPPRRPVTRLRGAVATSVWIVFTGAVMSLGAVSAALLAITAGRSVRNSGVSPGSLLVTGLALLVTYGIVTMSIGLVRSWFEKRLRRPSRQLRRLLRLLVRSGRGGSALFGRGLRRLTRRLGPSMQAAAGLAIVTLAVSLAIWYPVGAADAGPINALDPAAVGAGNEIPTGDVAPDADQAHQEGGDTAQDVSGDLENTPDGAWTPTTSPPSAQGPDTTSSSADTETTVTTGSSATTVATTTTTVVTTTTTTVAKATTTTTTVAKTTTTTSTAPDTTGPTVTGVGANPDLILVGETSILTAKVDDESGVGSVVVYYRPSGSKYQLWGTMTLGKGSTYTATFGPFGAADSYEYRIEATDGVGNASCRDPASCPGGFVTVTIL